MIDLKSFSTLAGKGAASILKTDGGTYAVAYSKYNESTGEKLSDEVMAVDLDELNKRKEELQNEIIEIDALIDKCNKI